jgi:threonine dehydratase
MARENRSLSRTSSAAAALLEALVPAKGARVGVIVSGGNVDLAGLAATLGSPAPSV